MTTARRFEVFNPTSLSVDDGVLQADGTIWSHACTLGTRTKGTVFCIDQATVENFVRVFNTGYPQKVPVDYDHALVSEDPEVIRARAMGKVPKAGDVKEMVGVFTVDDFEGSLREAAEKLCAKAGRSLDDPRNFGLWMRWEPTPKALQSIQAREYTELSITFNMDYPNNVDAEGQGPAILAVALTNFPFLDDMLPVAATRHGGSPAAPGNEEYSMKNLLASLALVAGAPVQTEEEAVAKVTTLGTELKSLRDGVAQRDRNFAEVSSNLTALTTELGVTDPKKAVAKVRELTIENKRFQDEAAAQKKARIDSEVATEMKKHEKKVTPSLRDTFYGPALRAELESGIELAKSKTVIALNALSANGVTERASGGDDGSTEESADVQLDKRARALMASDPELKALAEKDWGKAYDSATDRVAKEMNYRSTQMERAAATA